MSRVKHLDITIDVEDGYRIAFDVTVKSRPAPIRVIIMTMGAGEVCAMVDHGCGYDIDDVDAMTAAVMICGADSGDRDARKFLGEIALEMAENHVRQMRWAA